ncbi:MAG: ATP-dependent metallopeptidase FtsH/Yme1/Tma family protein, partial [Deltaproteobacteria bacterium]
MKQSIYKNLAMWLIIIATMVLLYNMFSQTQLPQDKVVFSDFMQSVEEGNVAEVTIQGNDIYGKFKDGKDFKTFAPDDPELVKTLRNKGVKISAKPVEQSQWWAMLISWFPMLLLIAVWIFFMRQMQVGGGKAMAFGKSRARLLNESQQKVTFKDVAG